ncbi:hypothetical protein LV779_38865 [Streptomyces thinghirensis]|nr:hypothetical protein [Streptomyces thinghirensis]
MLAADSRHRPRPDIVGARKAAARWRGSPRYGSRPGCRREGTPLSRPWRRRRGSCPWPRRRDGGPAARRWTGRAPSARRGAGRPRSPNAEGPLTANPGLTGVSGLTR